MLSVTGIRYDPDDPRGSDVDLWHGEITVHGKGRKTRIVKISTAMPALSTGTSAFAPGTPRHTGRSCGSG